MNFQHPDAPSLLLGSGSNTKKTRPGSRRGERQEENQTFTHPSLGSDLVTQQKGRRQDAVSPIDEMMA